MYHPSKGWRYASCALASSTSPGPLQNSPGNPMCGTAPPSPPEPCVMCRTASCVVPGQQIRKQCSEFQMDTEVPIKGPMQTARGDKSPLIVSSRRQSRAAYAYQAHINLNLHGEGQCEVVKRKLIKSRHQCKKKA